MISFDDAWLRLSVFIAVLVLCAVLEALFPRRQRSQQRSTRWLTNLGMVFLNSVVLRLMGPVAALSVAAYAQSQGWGLLSWLAIPSVLAVVVAMVLLDFAIYWQHVLSHKIPVLWCLHRVHHADRDIDVTTGIRFHPIEVMLSMVYKCAIVLLLGAPVIAVFLFEVLLNASAMFNHANMRLPLWLDRLLRTAIVTPDMHRVHHSVIEKETNSNYGFCLSIWDRWFGSYIPQPSKGHDAMTIGLQEYQHEKPARILWCLRLPFLR